MKSVFVGDELPKDMPFVHVHSVYEPQTGRFLIWELAGTRIKAVVGKPIDTVFSSIGELMVPILKSFIQVRNTS